MIFSCICSMRIPIRLILISLAARLKVSTLSFSSSSSEQRVRTLTNSRIIGSSRPWKIASIWGVIIFFLHQIVSELSVHTCTKDTEAFPPEHQRQNQNTESNGKTSYTRKYAVKPEII